MESIRMNDLREKAVFITGASRGIVREIALGRACDGANVVITGKTAQAHAKLPGTIHARHLPGFAGMHSTFEKVHQPAHPDAQLPRLHRQFLCGWGSVAHNRRDGF